MTRRRVALGAAVLLALPLLAALLWLARADRSLQRVQQAGVLRVGYAVEAPYAWVGADGHVTGESPASALRIAARLGLPRVEWVQVPFDQLIPALRQRRFDMVAAGLFITEARRALVRFSDPTVRVMPGLLVASGNPKAVRSYRDALRPGGPRIAALSGSVEQSRLKSLGVADAQLLVVPDAQAGRAAVAGGVAAALALSLPALRQMAQGLPGAFDVLADPDAAADRVGFAFHPDDAALQQAWNAAQAGWVGGEEQRRMLAALGLPAADIVAAAPGAAP